MQKEKLISFFPVVRFSVKFLQNWILIFTFGFLTPFYSLAAVSFSDNRFFVSDLVVESYGESQAQAENNLFFLAKKLALSELFYFLNINENDINLNQVEIDGIISFFAPKDLRESKENTYLGVFDVVFDLFEIREILINRESVVKISQNSKNITVVRASNYGRISSWLRVREKIESLDVSFVILAVATDFVEMAFLDESFNSLAGKMEKVGFRLIKNGNINFIKMPVFS